MIKALFDKFLAIFLLIVLMPFFILIMILISILIEYPPFFVHNRVGKDLKVFRFIKFKNLLSEYDANNIELQMNDRITPFGSFMRKYSIDELPQVINILKGEMSFIGPRPLEPMYLPIYSKLQSRRHDVLPGITGLAQVNGRNISTYTKRFKYDLYYVKYNNICMDIYIIIKTIKGIIKPEGINEEGHFNKPPFDGSN